MASRQRAAGADWRRRSCRSSPGGGSWRGRQSGRRHRWRLAAVAAGLALLCPQPAPRADGRPAGLPGLARPPADLTSTPGMRVPGPAAAAGCARAMELSMKKFAVRRLFSVYLRRKSRAKSSSLGRLEVTRRPPARPPAAGIPGPWSLQVPRPQAPPGQALKLQGSWSGFPELQAPRGLPSAPRWVSKEFCSAVTWVLGAQGRPVPRGGAPSQPCLPRAAQSRPGRPHGAGRSWV